MSINEHSRFKIVSAAQHPYKHKLTDFLYQNDSLPAAVTNAQLAIDYILAVLYPKTKPPVADVASLPAAGNDLGDLRIVQDDGDGKAAQYMWSQWDGQAVPQWNKVGDMDWGTDSVISGLIDQTQYLYVRKMGVTDYDPITELPLAGDQAGQHIYGGDQANQHLTLHANNGDAAGHTGFVQVDDDFRPLADLSYDLGTATERWQNAYIGTLIVGTATMTITSNGVQGSITDTSGEISFGDENLSTTGDIDGAIITASTSLRATAGADSIVVASGSITDSTGAISFGDENLSTTGTLAAGVTTIASDLILGAGSITSASGTIDFGDEDLDTTGTITAAILSAGQLSIDDVLIDGNTVSIQTLNTNLELQANGIGVVNVLSSMQTIGQTVTGTVDITGQLDVDNLTLNGQAISSSTNRIDFNSVLAPDADASRAIGTATERWSTIYLSSQISDGTSNFIVSELLELRNAAFRDTLRTQPAQAGDALFYNGSQWLASAPDTEITHSNLSGLTTGDAGHTQFALLSGRAGGQSLNGGTLTTQTLSLLNNAVDADGLIIGASIDPSADGTLSLGQAVARFDDLFMSGEFIGGRFQNTTDAGLAGLFNAADVGRQAYSTDSGFLYINNGTEFKKVGNNSYSALHTNVQIEAGVNVSAEIDDARNALWQLTETSTGEIMAVTLVLTATTVTASVDVSLPAGNYRLTGIEA